MQVSTASARKRACPSTDRIVTHMQIPVCPHCHGILRRSATEAACVSCGRTYAIAHDIIDFAPDEHYDRFVETDTLTAEHLRGLELEIEGSRRRIDDFYICQMRGDARRVLD